MFDKRLLYNRIRPSDIEWKDLRNFSFLNHDRFVLTDSTISIRENPASIPESFWPSHKQEFPQLEQFTRPFGSILPSSAPSDRVWSAMGRILNELSSHMEAEKALDIMFLNHHQNEFDHYVTHAAICEADDADLDKRDFELSSASFL